MASRFIGGVLLLVGICIGGAMLALPVTSAQQGFIPSVGLLIIAWLFMITGALYVLEVNLWFPEGSNMISMVQQTLGRGSAVILSICYLLLLYSLIAAYLSAGADVFDGLLASINMQIAYWKAILLFFVIFAFVVYQGIRSIDLVNRSLMVVKFSALFLLIFLIMPHVQIFNLRDQPNKNIVTSFIVMITSFGFASIIPSLREYFRSDVKQLKKVMWLGSLIPLLCYVSWNFTIMGVVPDDGPYGLMHLYETGHSTSGLVVALKNILNESLITDFARVFTSVSVTTSFLGVSLSLTDFFADALKIDKTSKKKPLIYLCTYLPPLLVIIIYPGAFIKALKYAGTLCVITLVLFPTLMVWSGRYRKKIASQFRVFGGKLALCGVGLAAVLIIILSVFEELH